MALSVVRAWVLDETGRNDLVNADGSDNGMDKYINAASRFLDMEIGGPKQKARAFQQITAGTYHIDVQDLRAAEEVWIANSDGRALLEQWDLDYIREYYNEAESDEDQGEPAYWAMDVTRLAPEQAAESEDPDFDGFYDYGSVIFSDTYRKATIYFMPPADDTYTMSVLGKFFQPRLSEDTDKNYWTEAYPEFLVKVAIFFLDWGFRDINKARELISLLKVTLRGIDFDMVEQQIANINQMEG